MKYNQIHKNNNVWRSKPNALLQKIHKQLDAGSEFLDLGCGQGRDSLFMRQKGFRVTAVDSSRQGIKKLKEFIQANNFPLHGISLFCEDIQSFNIAKDKYAVINAFNVLQFLPKKEALKLIDKIKKNIKNKGYVIVSGFTAEDPLCKKTVSNNLCFFESAELKKIFFGFNVLFYKEKMITEKGHAGNIKPHAHGVVKIIAQKIKRNPKFYAPK